MDAGELFLLCNNLTLGQYRIIVLARGLAEGAGCVVSLAVLGIVLLTAKKEAWESLPKRVYLAIVLYTLLYSIVAIVAVNYSHPPSQESTWCEAMGFLLQYSSTLVAVHYCALAFAIVFQVIVPVYQAVRKKQGNIYSPKKAKLWEVLLFLFLFLCPLLNSLEPLLPQLPSYGNYGPLCWFRLELTDNCTTNKSDALFLQNIPFAVVCFGYCVLTSTISLILCRMYCKFRTKTTGSRIITFMPTIVVMTVVSFMIMLWFIVLSAISSSQISSFSALLEIVTVIVTTIEIVVVGVYVYFPTHLCLYCKRASHQEGGENEWERRQIEQERGQNERERGQIEEERGQNEQQIVRPPEVAYRNTQPVITPHPVEVDHHNYPTHTTYNIPHSPVTTECTPLISTHPPEVVDHKYHTHTTCNISHEPVTTDIKLTSGSSSCIKQDKSFVC